MKKYSFILFIAFYLGFQFINPAKPFAQTAGTDSIEQLKPFVGKYQFTNNPRALLQIMLQDNHLVLRQLWDKREITFRQTSALEFYNDQDQFPLKFTKSSTGEITQVLAFNRDLWNRVADDYTPPLKKTIQLTNGQLKPFEGRYQLKGGDGDDDDIATITVVDGHLSIKHEQGVTNLVPVSALEFVTEDQSFDVMFTKANDGSVTQAVVNNRDVWLKDK
jgi:hypothetical protein